MIKVFNQLLNELEQKFNSHRINLNEIYDGLAAIDDDISSRTELKDYVLQALYAVNSPSIISDKSESHTRLLRRAKSLVRLGYLYDVLIAPDSDHGDLISEKEAEYARMGNRSKIKLFSPNIYLTRPGKDNKTSPLAQKYGIEDNTLGDIMSFAPIVDVRQPDIAAYKDGNFGRMFADTGIDGLGKEKALITYRSPTKQNRREYNTAETMVRESNNSISESAVKAYKFLYKQQSMPPHSTAILERCESLFNTMKGLPSGGAETFLYTSTLTASIGMAIPSGNPDFMKVIATMLNISLGYFAREEKADAPYFGDKTKLNALVSINTANSRYPDFTAGVADLCLNMQKTMEDIFGLDIVEGRKGLSQDFAALYSDQKDQELTNKFNMLDTRARNLIRKIYAVKLPFTPRNYSDNVWKNVLCIGDSYEDKKLKERIINFSDWASDWLKKYEQKQIKSGRSAESNFDQYDTDIYNDIER